MLGAKTLLALVFSLIVVAGLIRDAMLAGIFPHPRMVTSMTGASITTVHHILHREIGRGPGSLPLDVDAI